MRHDWQPFYFGNPADDMLAGPHRKCANCKKIQTRIDKTAWMRVIGYQWLPLVGRCHPTPTKDSSHG